MLLPRSRFRLLVAISRIIAIVGLPAYIGIRDGSVLHFAAYVIVAGIALALAERLTITHFRDEGLATLAQQSVLQGIIILAAGLPIYVVAILAH